MEPYTYYNRAAIFFCSKKFKVWYFEVIFINIIYYILYIYIIFYFLEILNVTIKQKLKLK